MVMRLISDNVPYFCSNCQWGTPTDQVIDWMSSDLQGSSSLIDRWSVSRSRFNEHTLSGQYQMLTGRWLHRQICDIGLGLCFGMFTYRTKNKYGERRIPNRVWVPSPLNSDLNRWGGLCIDTAISYLLRRPILLLSLCMKSPL